jgi:hypothetical protein
MQLPRYEGGTHPLFKANPSHVVGIGERRIDEDRRGFPNQLRAVRIVKKDIARCK